MGIWLTADRWLRFYFAMPLAATQTSHEFPPPHRWPGIVSLLAPRRASSSLLSLLAALVLSDCRIYLLDGVNTFDPYAFSMTAREEGMPDDVLDRVFVSRAFTIHQLAAAAHAMMRPLAGVDQEAIFVLLGLDHLFLEESLRESERARVLSRVISDIRAMREAKGRVLVTYEKPPNQRWWEPMLALGDVKGRMERDSEGWHLIYDGSPSR